MNIIKQHSVDINNISLLKPDRQRGLAHIKYDLNGKLVPMLIETDYMLMKFDASYENSDSSSYELLLSLTDESDLKSFFDDLDTKIMNDLKNNMERWFNISPDEKVKYKMLVKEIDDHNDSILKIKLRRSKSFRSLVFNDHLEEVTKGKLDDILISGNYVKVIFELPYVRFKNGKFSLYLKVHQIKVAGDDMY